MVENSKIEWCDHTFNGWVGCTKISPACDNCYAEAWAKRSGHPELWQGERRRTTAANWREPLKWNSKAEKDGTRPRVFCSSLADIFDNEVPEEWREDLFRLIYDTPNLDWLILTKRIGNAKPMLDDALVFSGWIRNWHEGTPLPNVWLGATIANQEEADRDIPKLLATPARVRFLSCEPLLGPIDLRNHRVCSSCESTPHDLFSHDPLCPQPIPIHDAFQCPLHWWPSDGCDGVLKHKIDWVIAGAESGPHARPSHPDWFRSLRDQCASAGVAYHHKQNGEWVHRPLVEDTRNDPPSRLKYFKDLDATFYRAGKKAAGRTLDGVIHDAFPEVSHGG